jgi:2-phospho-L-lactate guanylyltransferase
VKVALLPAKHLSLAKTRLASVLDDRQRMTVAAAMFADVLGSLQRTAMLDAVVVVTADPRLAARARATGALVVDEGTPRGLNGAVLLGTEAALGLGATSLLVLLSDVPLVTPADVDELVRRAPECGALVVPSKEQTGTNAMLRRPPALFPPCFGGASLRGHVAAAERQRVACDIVRNARIAFDVDTPQDLRGFVERGSDTETHQAIARLGIAGLRPTA